MSVWSELDPAALREVLREVATPMLVLDADGVVLGASEAAARALGVAVGQAVDAPLKGLFPAIAAHLAAPAPVREAAGFALTTPSGAELVGVVVSSAGTRTIVRWGDETQRHTALEDELRHANADLAQALKLRDEFLAATSHELRTPLHTILGLVESVLEGAFGAVAPSVERPLRATLEAARQQLGHINGILDLTKLEAGTAELRLELVSGDRIALDAVELSRAKAERAEVELAVAVDRDVLVEVDRKRMTRAVIELIDNAIKYTPAGGHVRVHARRDGDCLLLRVEDDGVGVDDGDRQRILQPFVQLDGSVSRTRNGLGLGLALVDRVVRLHDGVLAFDSERGKGSSVSVRVPAVTPVSPAVSTPSLRARSAESSLAGSRIVLVGSARFFEAHRDQLEVRGAEADVLSVAEAIERLEAAPIDVLVVGPGVAREDLARVVLTVRTHGYGARVAVVVFGPRPSAGDHEGWTSAGVEAWLEPTIDVRMFLQIVSREHRRRSMASLAPPELVAAPKA